jgi:methylmalonyl-CoA/ethylmalonyl-CoA epimerase
MLNMRQSKQPDVILDHVAIAVPDAAKATAFLVGELGGRPYEAGPGAGFLWWQWKYGGGGILELLEPNGPPDGFLHRFLAARGPGVHHVTFKVPDIHAAADRVASLGYDVVGLSDVLPDWKEAFIHPKQAQGILVQFAEYHPELEPEWGTDWPYPPAPHPASNPVDLIGLRLTALRSDRARQLWEDLLGGACVETGNELVFRWPDSPLRIAVSVDPDGSDGVRCLEIATQRSLALPAGPHPILGAVFVPLEAPPA